MHLVLRQHATFHRKKSKITGSRTKSVLHYLKSNGAIPLGRRVILSSPANCSFFPLHAFFIKEKIVPNGLHSGIPGIDPPSFYSSEGVRNLFDPRCRCHFDGSIIFARYALLGPPNTLFVKIFLDVDFCCRSLPQHRNLPIRRHGAVERF
jgi:hypothetical protein